MKRLRPFARHDGGATAVEFAFAAPAFFALLLGALQGALMFWTQLGLEHAVERAARCAAINSTICGTQAQVQAYALTQDLAKTLSASVFTLTSEACGQAVTATTSVSFVTSTVNLSARACFPK